MPRSMASERRAAAVSAWAILLFAVARLTLSPSASPVQPSRSESWRPVLSGGALTGR
jgi:hypothetical protein